MIPRHSLPVLAALMVCCVPTLVSAAGETAFSVERGNLYRFDVRDHSSVVVGETGVPNLVLAHLLLAEDGFLYGLCQCAPPWDWTLYRVDPASGAATAVAPLEGLTSPVGMSSDGAGGLRVVTFDRRLLSYDRTTGEVTGELALTLQGDSIARAAGRGDEIDVLTFHGSSFHPWVERIDLGTGVGQVIYEMPASTPGMASPQYPELDGRGGLWVYDWTGEIILGLSCYQLWRLDLAGGGAEAVWDGCVFVPADPALTSFAFAPRGEAEIPTLGTAALALLALLLAAAAWRALAAR
jgi:hypothetical protein